MFVGQTIRGVIYGEVRYFSNEEANSISPKPYYKSRYKDIDTLDHSVYFKTDHKTIYVFWDNTFKSYGLLSKQIDLNDSTNDYEQKWDVSLEPKWISIIGQKVVGFNIIWEDTATEFPDGLSNVYTSYPQTFKILLENGESIILSAAEFNHNDENEICPSSDNLLITTNVDLAKQLNLIK